MYYLSFDCATKSFAYSLSYVDLNNIDIKYQNLIGHILKEPSQCIKYFDEFKHSIIHLLDGEVIDFFPNISDAKIDTVERIQKISNYVKNTIMPKIKDINIHMNINIEIFIEFQMGSNHKARMISSALIAIFSEYKVRLINPSLKNKVYTSEEGKHKHFIKKYSNLYSANKEHARYNFCAIENVFGSNIPYTKKSDRGHIADSFMQVLGYLLK
jgi:hypothetical protein